jgi:hypothetical protein
MFEKIDELWDLKFSQPELWRFLSLGCILEEHVASIFRVQDCVKQETGMKRTVKRRMAGWLMIVEQLVYWDFAGESEVLRENQHICYFIIILLSMAVQPNVGPWPLFSVSWSYTG